MGRWTKAAVIFLMIAAVFMKLQAADRTITMPSEADGAEAGTEDAEGPGNAAPHAAATPTPEEGSVGPFVWVVPVPEGTPDEWRAALLATLRERFGEGEAPDVVGVAAEEGEAAYEPIPSAHGRAIRFIATQAGHNIVPFDFSCYCTPGGDAAAVWNALASQTDRELGLLVLRSALYRYAEDHEFELPASLEQLARPYPYNYISRLPDSGGAALVYRPEKFRKHAMWASLGEVLSAEGVRESYAYEEPLAISVYASSYRLALESGKDVIRQYAAGLGRPEQPTPEGMYQVELRVNEPASARGLFGTRALSFGYGEYAVHGTYDIATIGRPDSNGCIRLANEDVEELFALTPLGTTIRVVTEDSPHPDRSSEPRYLLPPGDGETTKRIFRWRG